MRKKTTGQGLLEMIIAIGIILVSLLTTLGLIFVTLHASVVSKNQILARNLAREGIEVVRAIRDTNWLRIDSGVAAATWNDELEESVGPDYTAIPSFVPTDGTWTLDFDPNETDMEGNLTVVSFNQDTGVYTQFDPATPPIGFDPTNYWRLLRLNPICWERVAGRLEQGTELLVAEGGSCQGNFEQVGVAVQSMVRWKERSNAHDISLTEYLYNWKQ